MIRQILMGGLIMVLAGCATPDTGYRGSGADKIHSSECDKCNQIPFYQDTVWVKNENTK